MNRYIPFGYKVENGVAAVDTAEAGAVRTAFEMYINGASYKKIAEYMESTGVNYRRDSAKWNKNMVKRILENPRYVDEIVDTAVFAAVAAIIAGKGACQSGTHPLDTIKGRTVCGECGQPYRRTADKRRKLTWYCGNRDCTTSPLLSDETMATEITAILNRLICNPNLIRATAVKPAPSLESTRLNNEINRLLNEREIDRDRVTALLLQRAAAEYNSREGDEDERESERLREVFSRQKPITEFDGGLFTKTVRRLIIAQNGAVSAELTNNQIIGRETM